MPGNDYPKEVKKEMEGTAKSFPPTFGIERGLTGPTDAKSSGRTPIEEKAIEAASQAVKDWGKGDVDPTEKKVRFEKDVVTDTSNFKSNRNNMLRHRWHFRETSHKIDGIYKDIKYLSDNVEETKSLFEKDAQIRDYLEREDKKDIKDFLERIEKTSESIGEKVTSMRLQARETIENFDGAESAQEQDEHLRSFLGIRGDASNILSDLEKEQKFVGQVKNLMKRAKENLSYRE
jgi:hypothetical protein